MIEEQLSNMATVASSRRDLGSGSRAQDGLAVRFRVWRGRNGARARYLWSLRRGVHSTRRNHGGGGGGHDIGQSPAWLREEEDGADKVGPPVSERGSGSRTLDR